MGRRSCCASVGAEDRDPLSRSRWSNLRRGLMVARLADIDGRLVAEIIRERQRSGVTNATIKRDLGALSSVLNFAILQGWLEAIRCLPSWRSCPSGAIRFYCRAIATLRW